MATKKTELHVDELLGSYEPSNKSKETKASKQTNNDWAEEEEENYAFGIAKDQQAAAKKAQKKKGAGKGWADVEAAQQTQPKTSDFAKIQEDEQKRKIIKKPGQGRPTGGVEIGSEAFPSLGEAPTKPQKKNPEPTPVVAPAQTDDGFSVVGPKRFTNAKKKEAGEHFAPLDPTVVEKAVPVAPVREKVENPEPTQAALPRGIFQRGKPAEQPAEVPTDTKFKFGGGEGPKKFSAGSKISFKREEEKDDHEALRLQKEREVEEKLQREREEAAKARENRDKKHTKEGAPTEHHQGHEDRKRFTNTKKEGDKPHEKPQPVPEVVESTEPKQPKESVEMHGTLSNKAWGEGPILKKKK